MTLPAPQKSLLDYFPTWLPVMMAIFGLIAFGVRADAQVRDIKERTSNYEQNVIQNTDRLARLEVRLTHIEEGQRRILDKLEALEQ